MIAEVDRRPGQLAQIRHAHRKGKARSRLQRQGVYVDVDAGLIGQHIVFASGLPGYLKNDQATGRQHAQKLLDIFAAIFRLHMLQDEAGVDEIEAVALEQRQIAGFVKEITALFSLEQAGKTGPTIAPATAAG